MTFLGLSRILLASVVTFLLAGTPVRAQALRTWVSGVGDDANPCSRTAPCKTFAGAISKTAAAGEISVLDPGGFGALTITKSISLVCDGVEGGLSAAGSTGITVNAGVNDVVSIRGLQIEGAGTGTTGIKVLQAKSVNISNSVIRGFNASPGRGVDISPTSASVFVFMTDTQVDDNIVGIYLHAPAGAPGGVIMNRIITHSNASNSIVIDTNTSTGRAIASVFGTSAASVTNGGALISAGNNFFAGGTGPTSTVPLQ